MEPRRPQDDCSRRSRMRRRWAATAVLLIVPAWPVHAGGGDDKAEGYAEWRHEDELVVDGQRVRPGPGLKFKGEGEAKTFSTIPLGYEVKAKGQRQADGLLLAKEIEAKPNGTAMFEKEVQE